MALLMCRADIAKLYDKCEALRRGLVVKGSARAMERVVLDRHLQSVALRSGSPLTKANAQLMDDLRRLSLVDVYHRYSCLLAGLTAATYGRHISRNAKLFEMHMLSLFALALRQSPTT